MNLVACRLFVDDLHTARRFYADTLALALIAEDVDHGHCVFDLGGPQLVIERVAPEAPADDRALIGRRTGQSLAVEDIAAEYQRLAARGVSFLKPPEKQFRGGAAATFFDPARNAWQLVQYLR